MALQIAPLHAILAEEVEVSDELNFSSPAYQEIESISIDSDELNFCPPSPEMKVFLLTMILIMNTQVSPLKQVQHQDWIRCFQPFFYGVSYDLSCWNRFFAKDIGYKHMKCLSKLHI